MGQNKVNRTLEWRRQQLRENANAHVKHLRTKWLEKQKETTEDSEAEVMEEVNDETESNDEGEAQVDK
jgi:hypothetical protein